MKKMAFLWRISLHGYGDFLYVGNEEEAQDKRARASWDPTISRKKELHPVGPAYQERYEQTGPFDPGHALTMAEMFSGATA